MKTLFAKLLGISSMVLDWFLPVLKTVVATGLASLLPVALDIVRELAAADLTGKQKLNNATIRLRAAAEKAGIEASASLINYTIEAAVQRLKAEEAK